MATIHVFISVFILQRAKYLPRKLIQNAYTIMTLHTNNSIIQIPSLPLTIPFKLLQINYKKKKQSTFFA